MVIPLRARQRTKVDTRRIRMWDGLDKGRDDVAFGDGQHDDCLACTALAVQVAAPMVIYAGTALDCGGMEGKND